MYDDKYCETNVTTRVDLVADLGGAPDARPHDPKCSQFLAAFVHKFDKIICCPPPPERIGVPSYGESASAPVIYKSTGSFTL